MKVILTEKITKLGNIGDVVEVKTGFARNYLLPNNKAMRCTKENLALFEAQKAELVARHENAKKAAEKYTDAKEQFTYLYEDVSEKRAAAQAAQRARFSALPARQRPERRTGARRGR